MQEGPVFLSVQVSLRPSVAHGVSHLGHSCKVSESMNFLMASVSRAATIRYLSLSNLFTER